MRKDNFAVNERRREYGWSGEPDCGALYLQKRREKETPVPGAQERQELGAEEGGDQ